MKPARALLISLAVIAVAVPTAFNIRREARTREYYQQTKRVTIPYSVTLPSGDIDVNADGIEALCSLYGIGEALAREIIREREQNGPYYYPEDLLTIKGIGRAKLRGFIKQLDYQNHEGE